MNRRAPAIAAVVGVAALALVLVFVVSPSGGGDDPSSTPLLGNLAPELVGTTMKGDEFDIDDHRGRWVLVNFFATWCPPCVEEHPELVKFSERNSGAVQLVSVAFDDTEVDRVERFFTEKGGDWPVLTSGARAASLDYGVKKLPESFLVDPSGVVVSKIAGGVTAAQLETLIAEQAAASSSAGTAAAGEPD